MRGTTHLVAGLLLAALLTSTVDYAQPVLAVILVLVGTLLPDVDEQRSILGRRVPVIGFLSKHRGFFHSVLVLVFLVIILSLFVKPAYLLAFALGFVLHLALDAMTPGGVTPFWPSKLKFKGFVRVGSWLEKGLYVALLVVFVFLLTA